MTRIIPRWLRREAAYKDQLPLPKGIRAAIVIDGDNIEVYDDGPEPVITEHAAGHFLDSVADMLDDEQEGLGEYLYDIDRIVAEETGEQYLRVLATAHGHGRIKGMHEDGLTPRAAACRLLAYVAKYTDDPDAAAEWTRRADEAKAAGR